MIKSTLLSILAVSLCLPALAEDDAAKRAEREAELRRMREKESQRANEAAQYAGDMESLERKFGWAKEDLRDQYNDLIEKRRAAAGAWKEAAQKLSRANDYDQVHALKITAYQAGAIAQLAELELRAAGSERSWNSSAEKANSEAAKQAARKLIENQKKMVDATRDKLIKEHQLRELERSRNELEDEFQKQCDNARRKETDQRDKGRKPEPRHEHRPEPPKPEPQPEHRDPPKIRIE